MGDANELAEDMERRLHDLNDKLAVHHRDVLASFEQYKLERLKDCSSEVAAEVDRRIAESMTNYPAFYSAHIHHHHPDEIYRKAWHGRRSPPPVLYHTSGTPKEPPRSPHARDDEFRGLFTPSYLPLLDGSERGMQSPPISPPPASPSFPPLPFPPSEPGQSLAPPPPATHSNPEQAARPAPIRRLTDRSTSSIDSSSSETRVRRSALRRTSSSTRGSPRRVRFEFQGTEVLPSSSPQASAILDEAVEAEESQPDASALIEEDESPDYTGPSLLDVEGEEDALPRPKKVSSTQALRALSQQPLDAGTIWTVVNADADDVPKMNGTEDSDSAASGSATPTPASARAFVIPTSAELAQTMPGRMDRQIVSNQDEPSNNSSGDDASDDEEFLSMGSKTMKTSASPAPGSPPTPASPMRIAASSPKPISGKDEVSTPASIPAASQPRLGTRNSKEEDGNDAGDADEADADDDHLFEFEDDGSELPRSTPSSTQKYIDDEETDLPPSPLGRRNFAPTAPPASSATVGSLPMRRPAPLAPMLAQSVGSYRGSNLSFTPINNPGLYHEIASMKDVHLFVGSVDGRTGPDEADMNNYRASLAKFSGVPRSFSEKLAFEEMRERKQAEEAEEAIAEHPAEETRRSEE